MSESKWQPTDVTFGESTTTGAMPKSRQMLHWRGLVWLNLLHARSTEELHRPTQSAAAAVVCGESADGCLNDASRWPCCPSRWTGAACTRHGKLDPYLPFIPKERVITKLLPCEPPRPSAFVCDQCVSSVSSASSRSSVQHTSATSTSFQISTGLSGPPCMHGPGDFKPSPGSVQKGIADTGRPSCCLQPFSARGNSFFGRTVGRTLGNSESNADNLRSQPAV